MDATTTAAAADQPQQMSELGRVVGVLTSPGATFADIVRKPTWITPIVLSTILGLAFAYAMNERINWKSYIRQRIEQSPRGADIPAERLSAMLETQARISRSITWTIGGAGPVLGMLVFGGIYLLVMNVMGGARTNYETAISIVAYAGLTGLVFGPLTIGAMWMRDYGDVTPENMVVTNLAALVPDPAPAWLISVASSFELFTFWNMILLAIGFSATNRRRLSTGKAFGLVMGVWVIGVFIKASLAAMSS